MMIQLRKMVGSLLRTTLLFGSVLTSDVSFAEPPMVSIDSPSNSVILNKGGSFTLKGHATTNNAVINGQALQWDSDRDGALGQGTSVDVKLSAGVHLINLTATAPNGEVSRVSVKVTVNN